MIQFDTDLQSGVN